jgi:hypothetical protein
MNRFHTTGRLAVILAGLAGALLAFWTDVPAVFAAVAAPLGGAPHGRPGLHYGQPALASPPPGPPGWNKHPPLPLGHEVGPVYQVPARIPAHAVAGGMPGWQITLIAAGAALLAAALAVLVYRMRAARRRVTVSAA